MMGDKTFIYVELGHNFRPPHVFLAWGLLIWSGFEYKLIKFLSREVEVFDRLFGADDDNEKYFWLSLLQVT